MKKVLVTGGAGFIGAYLVKKLIESGVSVTIVDCLKDVGGISYVHPEARFINADICSQALYLDLRNRGFDTVFHLAAQSAGEPSYDDPSYDIMTNSFGTYQIAKFCKETGVDRLIYTSTVAVYGNTKEGALAENSLIDPDSIYGVSKYSGEMYIKQLLKNSKTKYSIFRVFNTYGPGENLNFRKKGMVSIYISYLWKNEPIKVKGSLDRYRDFTYIDDTVDALLSCISNSRSFGETYNLSSGIKTEVRQLLDKILLAFGKSIDYDVLEQGGTPGDSFGFHSDVEKIQNQLNWSPKVDLDEGLSKYSQWVMKVPVKDKLGDYHPFIS